jgi:Asp-tRNA(Asn)/Glu-tRNA(Gln) amidotransferase A subunit family amidase
MAAPKPNTNAPLNELSAAAAGALIAQGKATSRALVETCLLRIEEREPTVGAWAWLDPEQALAEADARDREPRRGPLHGVPVGIKDIMDTADMPTEHGSPIYRGNRPPADSAVVAALRAAGAVIMGKTVTTEFAAFNPGKTTHPMNPAHTPGGSSSGSAAAVADFMVPAALGTQTMGSVIRPAAYCGVIGYKPSFGTFPRAGVKPSSDSVDTIGLFARSLDDIVLLSMALTGGVADDFDDDLGRPPRIGLFRGPHWSKAEPAAATHLEEAARTLASAGAEVTEIADAPIFAEAFEAHRTIVVYEMARALGYEWHGHRGELSKALLEMVSVGAECPFGHYLAAQETVGAARQWFAENFTGVDVWLALSAPGEAPAGLAATGDPVFNRPWTVLHNPAITLPAGNGPQDLPLGVQVVGRFRDDARVVAASRWIAAHLS